MKKYIFILIVFLTTNAMYSNQDYIIDGTFAGFNNKKLIIYNYDNMELHFLDTIKTNNNGRFEYKIKNKNYIGLLKIKLNKDEEINLIINNENIVFKTSKELCQDSVVFTESIENKIYYDYLNYQIKLKEKEYSYLGLIKQYQGNNTRVEKLIDEMTRLTINRNTYIDSINKKYTKLFVPKLLKFYKTAISDTLMTRQEIKEFQKKHYWDFVDFNDTTLLNTQIYSYKVFSFLSLYNEGNTNDVNYLDNYYKPIDFVLNKASINKKVFDAVLDRLISESERVKADKLYIYITEKYVIPYICSEDSSNNKYTEKLEETKRTALGAKAPEFVFNDKKLSDINAKYTLIVFWASWCEHCKTILDDLKKVYEKHHDNSFEIIAIAIDDNKTKWEETIKKRNFPWINYSEFKSWNGSISKMYNVKATPTLFLLDSSKTIISKPISVNKVLSIISDK